MATKGYELATILQEELPSLPSEFTDRLPRLLPIPFAYEWFAPSNIEMAEESFAALVAAFRESRNDVVTFCAGAITDLYHKDRADRAVKLLCSSAIAGPI